MKNYWEKILIDKDPSVVFVFSNYNWGFGVSFYFNAFLTFYIHCGPFCLHISFYKIHRHHDS